MTRFFRPMANLSVRLKLMAACGSLALLTVFVGALGLLVFTIMQDALQGVITHSLPAVDAMLEAGGSMQEALVAERALLFMPIDTPDAKKQREIHAASLGQVVQQWQKYIALPASEHERQQWSRFETAWRAWESASQEVLALLAEDTRSARRDAVDLSLSEGTSKFEAARAMLYELTQMRLTQVRTHTQAKERRVEQLRWWVVSTVVGVCVLALALSLVRAHSIARPLRQVAGVLQRVAEGDLGVTVDVTSKDEAGQVAAAARQMVGNLRALLTRVNISATQTTTVSQQLSTAAKQLSAGARQQATSLEKTAVSLEQITGTVKQNADNARQASQCAAGARTTAEKGGQVVTAAVVAMDEMSQSAKRIVDITTIIDGIAFQTNLLALNAAVEAARAGEHGRGFAVVAAEVRNLAQRSAAAAKEIKTLIGDSVHKMQKSSQLVHRSGQTLQEIVVAVKQVTDMIAEITAASQEQSAAIEQVHREVSQMDQVTQSNTGQTEALTTTAHTLAVQAEQLQGLVGQFKLDHCATEQPLEGYTTTQQTSHGLFAQLPCTEDDSFLEHGLVSH